MVGMTDTEYQAAEDHGQTLVQGTSGKSLQNDVNLPQHRIFAVSRILPSGQIP